MVSNRIYRQTHRELTETVKFPLPDLCSVELFDCRLHFRSGPFAEIAFVSKSESGFSSSFPMPGALVKLKASTKINKINAFFVLIFLLPCLPARGGRV
jgi:hypothetical protein